MIVRFVPNFRFYRQKDNHEYNLSQNYSDLVSHIKYKIMFNEIS